MVDIHCHILPEVDDGAVSLEEAAQMARTAADDGIDTIVATPHIFDGVYPPPDSETIQKKINEVLDACSRCINIVPGGEVRFSYEIFQETEGKRIRLNGTSYMLLEFPYHSVPPNIENAMFQILNAGITPVIAHPERNLRMQERPLILADLIERGAYAQIDAGSLTKSFGGKAFEFAQRIIRSGSAHFIATDGHHRERRRPILSDSVKIASNIGGAEYALAMVNDNPAALISDKMIPYQLTVDIDALTGKKRKRFILW